MFLTVKKIEMKREYTDQMREISGFGGEYEEACRNMVLAGVKWLDENPEAKLSFGQYANVTGITVDESDDMKKVQDVMLKECDGCSGAMMHACSNHLMFIHKNGWDKYVKEMESDPEEKNPEVES